jgi:hypothetical protein
MRRRLLAVVSLPTIMLAGSMALANVTPVAASATGAVVFEGAAALPVFPGSGAGVLNGTAAGTVAGVVGTAPYAAVFAAAPLNANFNYVETCPAAVPVPPATGAANGAFVVTNGTAVGALTSPATLRGNFAWTRVGLVAVIVTSGTTVTGGNGVVASGVLPDVSAAVFVPLPPVGTCTAPGPQNAVVVGADAEAA